MKIIDIHPNYLNDEIANKIVSNYELKKRYCRKYKDYFGGADANADIIRDRQQIRRQQIQQMGQNLRYLRLPYKIIDQLNITFDTIFQLYQFYKKIGKPYPHYSAGLNSISAIKPLASYPPDGNPIHHIEDIQVLRESFNISDGYDNEYIKKILLIIFRFNHYLIADELKKYNLVIKWNVCGNMCNFWVYDIGYIKQAVDTFNSLYDKEYGYSYLSSGYNNIFTILSDIRFATAEYRSKGYQLTPSDKLLICVLFGNHFTFNKDGNDLVANLNQDIHTKCIGSADEFNIFNFYKIYFQNCKDAHVDVISVFLTAYGAEYNSPQYENLIYDNPEYGNIFYQKHYTYINNTQGEKILKLILKYNELLTLNIYKYLDKANQILHGKTHKEYAEIYMSLVEHSFTDSFAEMDEPSLPRPLAR